MLGPALGAGLMSAGPLAAIMPVDIIGTAFIILCLLVGSIPDAPCTSGKEHILSNIKNGLTAMGHSNSLYAAGIPISTIGMHTLYGRGSAQCGYRVCIFWWASCLALCDVHMGQF